MIQTSKPSSYDILDTALKLKISANVIFVVVDTINSTYTMTVEESIQEPYIIEEQVYDDNGEIVETISNTFYQTKNLRTYKEVLSFEEVDASIDSINIEEGNIKNDIASFILYANYILLEIYNKKLIRNSTWIIDKPSVKEF